MHTTLNNSRTLLFDRTDRYAVTSFLRCLLAIYDECACKRIFAALQMRCMLSKVCDEPNPVKCELEFAVFTKITKDYLELVADIHK
jgi:hypothetical protein